MNDQDLRTANKAAAVTAAIATLSGLPLEKLRMVWAAELGRDPPKGLWRALLLRTLAWRLQEKAFGGHDKRTLKLLEAYWQKKPGDQRCQRLKSGTVLIREFQGVRHTVTIVPEGFIWREKTWTSLSAIARIITGANWNGPRFFGLREEGGRKAGREQERAA